MTLQVLFNQFGYADRLKNGGFTEQQARAATEALADALTEAVATKSDITELKGEIAAVRGEIGAVETRLKAEIKAEIATVRGEIAGLKGELKADIAGVKNDVIRWVLMLNIASAGLLFTAIKLLK